MDIKPTTTEEWYIIFTESKVKTGVMGWLRRDFSHVYAMKKSPGGEFWIIVNPLANYTATYVEMVADYPHPRLYSGNNAVILPVTANIPNRPMWSLCVLNCVEVVKSLIGVKSFWTLTPWQLYKYLRRQDERYISPRP